MRRKDKNKRILTLLLCSMVLVTACGRKPLEESSIVAAESEPGNGTEAEEIAQTEIEQTETEHTEIQQSETKQIQARDLSAETDYVFRLAYDRENHLLNGNMKAMIKNCSGDSWNKIVINDWATTPYYEEKAYLGYAPTDFMNATITMGDQVIPVTMQRQSNLSSLDVDAGTVIPDGETIVFETDFVVHIPYVQYRYGYTIKEDIERVALGNALPVLGLYKDGDWVTHTYIEIGESFNSEIADYDVTFTCPPEYEVVMTGIPEVKDSTYHSVEKSIRDFTIMLATQHTTYVEDHKGLRITIWGNNELGDDLPVFAEQTGSILDFYTELIGPYPYDSIDVCLFDITGAGGMEYPELVTCNAREAYADPRVLAHEIGHEWFYLLIGNDEFAEPWIDESMASYITNLYMESVGYDVTDSYVPESYKVYYDMSASVSAMADDKYYLMSAYAYGPTFLRDLHGLMGDEAFIASLHEIYDTYIFRQADTEGVLDIFRKHSQESIEDLVKQYFKENSIQG